MQRTDEKKLSVDSSKRKYTPQENVFNNYDLSKYIADYLSYDFFRKGVDRFDLSSFSIINKITFNATKDSKNYIRKDDEKDFVNRRNILASFRKVNAARNDSIKKSIFHSGDFKAITAAVKKINPNAKRDEILEIINSITLSGNHLALKFLFNQLGLHTNFFIEDEINSLMKFSILSGKVDMAKFVKEWLGWQGKPHEYTVDMVLTAILSSNSNMLDYVLSHIEKKSLASITSENALTCWKEAFNSQNLKLMKTVRGIQPIVNALQLDPSKKISNIDYKEFDTLCTLIMRNSFDEISAAWNFLISTPLLGNFFAEFLCPENCNLKTIYQCCLHRDDEFRAKICKLFNIDIKKFSKRLRSDLFEFSFKRMDYFLNYKHDFEIDYKEINNHDDFYDSFAGKVAWRGGLDVLKHTIEVIQLEPTINSSLDATSFLCKASVNKDPAVFDYAFNYIKNRYPNYIKHISWAGILSMLHAYRKEKDILPMIKTVTRHMQQKSCVEIDDEIFISGSQEAIKLNNHRIIFSFLVLRINCLPCPIIKFLVEEFHLKSKIINPFTPEEICNGFFGWDPMLDLIRNTESGVPDKTLVLRYFIEELKYDIKTNSDKIIKAMHNDQLYFEPNRDLNNISIIEYFIDNGLELTKKTLDDIKQRKMEWLDGSLEHFNSLYPRFDSIYERLDKAASIALKPSMSQ